MIAIGVALHCQHLADYNIFDLGALYLIALYLGAGHGKRFAKIMNGCIYMDDSSSHLIERFITVTPPFP